MHALCTNKLIPSVIERYFVSITCEASITSTITPTASVKTANVTFKTAQIFLSKKFLLLTLPTRISIEK